MKTSGLSADVKDPLQPRWVDASFKDACEWFPTTPNHYTGHGQWEISSQWPCKAGADIPPSQSLLFGDFHTKDRIDPSGSAARIFGGEETVLDPADLAWNPR